MQEQFLYIGEDGSLGYRTGEKYWLLLAFIDRHLWIRPGAFGLGDCPYDSMRAFLKNWQPVA
jgi:hypothetical protein